MSALTVRGVAKAFGPVRAVDGVDLTVPQGSITAVLGQSGCGKTTLLRLVAGFLDPDEGTIAFDGRVVAGEGRRTTPQQRRVGYVPQEGALFPHLDVAGNIGFGLGSSSGDREARVRELLALVDLPESFLNREPHELSGGQQQRVALARALAPEPAMVLLDEPFSSLDTSLRQATGRAVVRALRAAGATGLLVTHDQGEALSLADQVAVMRAGRLVQVAAPAELYRRPADAGVAEFLGGVVPLAATVSGGVATLVLGEVPVGAGTPDGARLVLLRPEQIGLCPAADARVSGVVDEVSYYGHDAAVRIRVGDASVLSRVGGDAVPELGARVGLVLLGPAATVEA